MDKKQLSLKQKIAQMFIVGFSGTNFHKNQYFEYFVKNALGGVIFFSHNIESVNQFKKLISDIKNLASIPMFYSIDQEGGRVERTENIHNGKKYLSAKYAYQKGIEFLKSQTEQMADELLLYGINMNFTPVLDVNTNDANPIIGERAFSNITQDVIEATQVVLSVYKKKNIITVGKHFPGHGAASSDSHKTLPIIDLSTQELEDIHIKPFDFAIKSGIPSIMVAHVLYPALEKNNLPASVSYSIVNDLLINKLNFNGVIITDDMEMNGIKGLSPLQACISAINAGISMFIFRDANIDIFNLINDIESAVLQGLVSEDKINNSISKVFNLKYQYGIIQ